MTKLKIVVAVLILILGLFAAYSIISNNADIDDVKNQNPITEIANNPVGIEPITASSTRNITDILTQKIAEGIANQNQEGFITSNSGQTYINAPEPQKMISELISEAQNNFDPASLRSKISDSAIKTSNDNSKIALTNYFESFNRILAKASENIPDTLSDEMRISIYDVAKTQKAYEYAINEFYKLIVPSSLLEINKKEIELLTVKKNIFEKLANAEQDPMTALLSTNELLKIDQEFATLKIEIDKFIKANLSN